MRLKLEFQLTAASKTKWWIPNTTNITRNTDIDVLITWKNIILTHDYTSTF